jgi:hypothetical protein
VHSGQVTKVLGYLLAIAGVASITDIRCQHLVSNYDNFEALFLAVGVVRRSSPNSG